MYDYQVSIYEENSLAKKKYQISHENRLTTVILITIPIPISIWTFLVVMMIEAKLVHLTHTIYTQEVRTIQLMKETMSYETPI